jgi:hypothetical protein
MLVALASLRTQIQRGFAASARGAGNLESIVYRRNRGQVSSVVRTMSGKDA